MQVGARLFASQNCVLAGQWLQGGKPGDTRRGSDDTSYHGRPVAHPPTSGALGVIKAAAHLRISRRNDKTDESRSPRWEDPIFSAERFSAADRTAPTADCRAGEGKRVWGEAWKFEWWRGTWKGSGRIVMN
jgi:hypothetical protein